MNIILIFLFFLGINAHDVQVSHYKIKQEDQQLVIDFVFEYDDIVGSVKSPDNLSDEQLQQYIKAHFAISLNNKRCSISFREFKIRNKHIFVQGKTSIPTESIDSIEIINTCLITIDDHSNIVEVSLNNKQRDFLMNKERTTILINY